MQISDTAIILHTHKYAERDLIVHAFTREHGVVHGLIKGAYGKKTGVGIDAGVLGALTWNARLPEHLGTIRFETETNYAAMWMNDRAKLYMLGSACALIRHSFALHDAHVSVFDGYMDLLEVLRSPDAGGRHARHYIAFECMLLEEAGYGLDLSQCAATGATDDLIYVSPKSGRAVSAAAGAPYAGRLLPLPAFLRNFEQEMQLEYADIAQGLRMTGHFIAHSLKEIAGKDVPHARQQLIKLFSVA